jgi:7-cyano-7-deazaguanine synthase
MKVVLGLSGGMDSATLCGYYLDKGYQVVPVSFNYGSKHNPYEIEMARKLADYWGLNIQYINLDFINSLFKSNLLSSGGEIPEGHYQQENMSQTVVPGRNIIFASIMAGYAWSIGAEIVAIGAHLGDHAIYDDCRAGFNAAMNAALIAGTGDRVRLEVPFQYLDKTGILKVGYGLKNPVPYELTRTCYKEQELSCGCCGSCQERLEAFKNIGVKDPIRYE